MAKGKIPFKFQIRLETPRGWEALTDDEKAAIFTALQGALDALGVDGKARLGLYGPQWEELNVGKHTECVWEIDIPLTIVEYVGA